MSTDDIRLMHDYKWLRCIHLRGREVTVQIEAVEKGVVEGERGRKANKPVLRFRGQPLPFAISKTDTKTLVRLYGPKAADLVGKWITLVPSTTSLGNDTVDCIRIKPSVPNGRTTPNTPSVPHEVGNDPAA